MMPQPLPGSGYDWLSVYARYLEPKSPVCHQKSAGPAVFQQAAEAEAQLALEPTLDVDPFVGPVKIALAEGRGRGLFTTEPVKAGQLLVCAKAVVAGPNEQLLGALASRMLRSSELQRAVLGLSRGSAASEKALPDQSLLQLVSPDRMAGGRQPIDATWEDLLQILWYNQFALPLVDAKVVPMEVSSDASRSGLWLLPSYINSSCCPNVQKLVVLDRLFLRAGQDLEAGAELFLCYCNTLQPLSLRQEALQRHGFTCRCERCLLETAALDSREVRGVVDLAASAAADKVIARARNLVERALGKISTPAVGEAAERSRCTLLASFGEALSSTAVRMRRQGRFAESADAWQVLLPAMDAVQPCSEVGAIVHTDLLCSAIRASPRGDHTTSIRRAVWTCHLCYGGGAPVWRLLNANVFAAWVLKAGMKVSVEESDIDAERCPVRKPASPRYTIDESAIGEHLVVNIFLPGISAPELSLEVSDRVLRLGGHPHGELRIALPRAVDSAVGTAKWSRRAQSLTVPLKLAGNA